MVEAFHRELAGVDGAAYGREVTLNDRAVHDPRGPSCVSLAFRCHKMIRCSWRSWRR